MLDFQQFCTRDYLLTTEREKNFTRLKKGSNVCYLDNAGASLYSEPQIQEYSRALCTHVYGNPHSGNQSSSRSTDTVEQVRQRVARFFNTSLDEYSVIFTSGCTASLKLLAESFCFHCTCCSQSHQSHKHSQVQKHPESSRFSEKTDTYGKAGGGRPGHKGGVFCFTEDNHTSVVGMREIVKLRGHKYHCMLQGDLEQLFTKGMALQNSDHRSCSETVHISEVSDNIDIPELNGRKTEEKHGLNKDITSLLQNPEHIISETAEMYEFQSEMDEQKHGADTFEACCCHGNSLFVFPAQSNFNGRKYPLSWIEKVQSHHLKTSDQHRFLEWYKNCRTGPEHSGEIPENSGKIPENFQQLKGDRQWYVGLDAASFVSTSHLDLSQVKPDFVTLSFYKIFGFPTGLGALLVRNESAHTLQKAYFGGGTVDVSISREDFHVPRKNLTDRFEDGTISFLDILALNFGFDSLQQIAGSMADVNLHTFQLARFVYRELHGMAHDNGAPAVRLYHHGSHFDDITAQGPIICFNVLRADGSYVGYSQVDKLAQCADIHLRTGCFCNMGACQHHLSLTSQRIRQNYTAGHVCGDDLGLIEGHPTGACRISFGYYSTLEDALVFLNFMYTCFVESSDKVDYINHGKDRLKRHYGSVRTLSDGHSSGRDGSGKFTESGQKLDLLQSGNGVGCKGIDTRTIGKIEKTKESNKMSVVGDSLSKGRSDTLSKHKEGVEMSSDVNGLDVVQKSNKVEDLVQDIYGKTRTKESCDLFEPDGGEQTVEQFEKSRSDDGQSDSPMVSIGGDVVANGYKGERVLTNICLYPVKSCGAFEVRSWELGPRGLVYDREWMVTTETGICLSQKREPRLCLIKPEVDLKGGKLRLRAEGHSDLELDLVQRSEVAVQGKVCQSKVCGDRVQGSDCGDEASVWLDRVLGQSGLRLVRQSETDHRSIRMSQQKSLDETLGRFRANLVVSTDAEFEEDHWREICIGSHSFVKQRQCTRCQMVTVNQRTGEKCKEPLLQLARQRHRKMTFGILLYQKDSLSTNGRFIRVGDLVQVVAEDCQNNSSEQYLHNKFKRL